MAQLALAAGGAFVGRSLFGGLGGGIGWLAGSLVGAWLFNPNVNQTGPRIDDLTVTASTYGVPIPIGYGAPRMPGNVIWSSGLQEKKSSSSSGKGFGGSSSTTYTYWGSLAVCFANRESEVFLKVWADTKLIYDCALNSAGEPQNFIQKDGITINFYYGAETQEADATIESYEGAGEVPAYRGYTYLVITFEDLADFANRFPSISAQIAFSGTDVYPYQEIVPSNYDGLSPAYHAMKKDPARPYLWHVGQHYIYKINSETGEILASKDIATETGAAYGVMPFGGAAIDNRGCIYCQTGEYNYAPVWKFDPNSLNPIAGIGTHAHWGSIPRLIWNRSHLHYMNILGQDVILAISGAYTIKIFATEQYSLELQASNSVNRNPLHLPELAYRGYLPIKLYTSLYMYSAVQDKYGYVWIVGRKNGYGVQVIKLNIIALSEDDLTFTSEYNPATANTLISATAEIFDLDELFSYSGPLYLDYYAADHSLLIGTPEGSSAAFANKDPIQIAKYDIASDSITYTWESLTNRSNFWCYDGFKITNDKICIMQASGGFVIVNATDLSEYYKEDFDTWIARTAGSRTGYYYHSNSESVYTLAYGAHRQFDRYYLFRKENYSESLDAVVTDICKRCGLTAADIDVTDLAAYDVKGYRIGNQTTGRSAIEPLTFGYFFSAAEIDWKLYFRLRGRTGDFSIPQADLAAHTGNRPEENLVETYIQEIELPEAVYTEYLDEDTDQQRGEQYWKRRADVVNTKKIQKISMPIVFSATEAKEKALKWVYQIWNEQTGIQAKVSQKWLQIDPIDGGTITDGDTIHGVRIEAVKLSDFVIDLDAIREDDRTYTDTGVTGAAGDGYETPEVTTPGETDLYVLDINLLRDIDEAGASLTPIYLAPLSNFDDWDGANIYKSTDATVYSAITTATSVIAYGSITENMIPYVNWPTWDRYNTITVQIAYGENQLSSATELQVLNGANAALIGNEEDGFEIIQFTTVTDNGSNNYTLSNLLRGRRGTNENQTHNAGDIFILLNEDSILKHEMPIGDISTTRWFKSVTYGAAILDATAHSLDFEGTALKPYSPTSITGSRDGSNNLTINWIRRTRYGGEWLNYVGTVPIGEDSEAYEVDILDSNGDVVRTIDALTSTTASYTAAEQTTDGFTPGEEITCKIYQISAIVGRGYGATKTI